MKRKFVSSAENTWKSLMFDTDFMICLCLFLYFLAWFNFIIIAETTTFPKIRLCSIISRCKYYNTRVTRTEMTFAQNQFNFSLSIKLWREVARVVLMGTDCRCSSLITFYCSIRKKHFMPLFQLESLYQQL